MYNKNNSQSILAEYTCRKKWDNLNHSYALHFFYYNFMRIHSTLRVTPAMESKLTDHVWSWEELIRSA